MWASANPHLRLRHKRSQRDALPPPSTSVLLGALHCRSRLVHRRAEQDWRWLRSQLDRQTSYFFGFFVDWYNTLRDVKDNDTLETFYPRNKKRRREYCEACGNTGFDACRFCNSWGHRTFWGSSRRHDYERMLHSDDEKHRRLLEGDAFLIERRVARCRHCCGFGWLPCHECKGHTLPTEWQDLLQ
ncbi:hypothetical protein CDCA_CDCA20G4858 [Cyanidium caldarium]|uniref:Uncharacterized protein n=1 Tax=Cyanidium caldarium TaxID=2771 RepID=A0AAV9J4C5_CYACA|nr:hypothetical protein CDCA_CDCA20G4858 [Cyanidium caldarium]